MVDLCVEGQDKKITRIYNPRRSEFFLYYYYPNGGVHHLDTRHKSTVFFRPILLLSMAVSRTVGSHGVLTRSTLGTMLSENTTISVFL